MKCIVLEKIIRRRAALAGLLYLAGRVQQAFGYNNSVDPTASPTYQVYHGPSAYCGAFPVFQHSFLSDATAW